MILVSQAMSHWYHKNVSARIFFGIKWTIYRFFWAITPLRERYLQRNILFIRKKGEPINSPSSDPVGIRTQDLRLRRPLLYPAELPNRVSFNFDGAKIALSRINTNIRTYFFRLKWTPSASLPVIHLTKTKFHSLS